MGYEQAGSMGRRGVREASRSSRRDEETNKDTQKAEEWEDSDSENSSDLEEDEDLWHYFTVATRGGRGKRQRECR